ncbi:hypothetical protein NLJ89_g11456 [Agrocybe chaxingu]|uniref:Bromo domain-containing protein n=1 Tax=Agrocybe chaxingu TaxID=84603 RepID=A0A9W8MQ00_9AGAR|nr:hypothetical protein NLJ89_g11456 [Agrocybe chaxingu]
MPITPDQNAAIKEIITTIINQTAPRGKRQLAAMFMDLVDRRGWPHYYEVIPEPRCLKQIQSGVEKGRYREATDVYTDLSLVFWNALYYNEDDSQIAADAKTLKNTLETEWRKRSVLPNTRSSPPPSSAQKVHGGVEAKQEPAPTPAASTSQSQSHSQFAYTKPIPIRPKSSAQKQPTPDVDVDVVSPDSDEEGEGPSAPGERDPRSEEIVKQLEKGLPRFPGFGEEGWMDEVAPDRLSDIVHTIKSYKDVIGNRVATCLESLPEDSSPALYLSDTAPISLKQIETRTRHKMYKNAKDFDKDMMRLFEKARRWHEPGTEAYGRALLLQRLYQALTGPNPIAPPYVSSTNFASLRAGPGNVKPVHAQESDLPSVTVNRTLTKDRVFVDEVHFKGWRLGVADWVHLSNPDDPSRPIIGQVFKCWLSDEFDKKGNPGITVSWYYRPEQTFHPANRQFWANEVFKTGT